MRNRRELITTAGLLFLAGCSSDENPPDNTNQDEQKNTDTESTVDTPELTLIDYEQVEPAEGTNSEKPEILEHNTLEDKQELLIQGMFELPNGCYESTLQRVDLSGTTLRYIFESTDTSDENTVCTQQIQQITYTLKIHFSGDAGQISVSARHPEETYSLRYNLADDS